MSRLTAAIPIENTYCSCELTGGALQLPEVIAFTFKAIDADGSGAVEPDELLAFLVSCAKQHFCANTREERHRRDDQPCLSDLHVISLVAQEVFRRPILAKTHSDLTGFFSHSRHCCSAAPASRIIRCFSRERKRAPAEYYSAGTSEGFLRLAGFVADHREAIDALVRGRSSTFRLTRKALKLKPFLVLSRPAGRSVFLYSLSVPDTGRSLIFHGLP